jgi:hypothetical protein
MRLQLKARLGLEKPYETQAPYGASFLDLKRAGWQWEVNPRTVNVASLTDCPLGQIYGSYNEAMNVLGGTSTGIAHGFIVGRGGTKGRQQLNGEWARLIRERRREDRRHPDTRPFSD